MSFPNSVFSCRCCNQLLRDRKEAYVHILLNWGLKIDSEMLEMKFLKEERVF